MAAVYSGRNRYRTFLKAGRIITEKIARLDGVVGVLGNGAIGRGFGDRFSDLDLVVYAEPEAVKAISRTVSVGWISYKGMDFDIPTLSYERALKAPVPSRFWSQVRRWDHQQARVLYDSNDRLTKLLTQKLIYPDRERQQLLAEYRTEVQEHLVYFPEMWAERGQLYHVVDTLVQAVRCIVRWIYARNRVFEPYPAKWLFYHLETKSVPEYVHLPRLTEVYTQSMSSLKDALELRQRLLRVCGEIGLSWEVNSTAEAQQQSVENWKRVSATTRDILSW